MRKSGRLEKLEKRAGAPGSIMAVFWNDTQPDDIIELNDGRKMTLAEFERLYPESEHIELKWNDEPKKR